MNTLESDSGRERLKIGKQIVVFTGPEGSGKSILSKLLAVETNVPYVATGDILRDMAKNDKTEYGDECRNMLAEHRYLNPQMLLDILVKRFQQNDLRDGFILDGGLRTVEEVLGFQSVLNRAGRAMPVTVIHLRIPGWMGMERVATGENARKRDDDTVDGMLSRLSNFYNNLGQRATLITNQKNWSYTHVDATGTVGEAFNNVRHALSTNLLGSPTQPHKTP